MAGFHGGSDGKESACSEGDLGSIPGLERSPGEGNGYLFKFTIIWGFVKYFEIKKMSGNNWKGQKSSNVELINK